MPEANGDEAAGEDAEEDMPDLGEAGHQDDDGWGSYIKFEISNAVVILISFSDEEWYIGRDQNRDLS